MQVYEFLYKSFITLVIFVLMIFIVLYIPQNKENEIIIQIPKENIKSATEFLFRCYNKDNNRTEKSISHQELCKEVMMEIFAKNIKEINNEK